MPPKTRGHTVSKKSKENVGANRKSQFKTTGKVSKPARQPLADKTNSASDDNETFLPSQAKKVAIEKSHENLLVKQRPRRDRRVPTRYVENSVLLSLSNSKNAIDDAEEPSPPTPVKKYPIVVLSPLKFPKLTLDTSLTARRPKRICRLPSKFDNHSISPSKFVPVHPAYASTPKGPSKSAKTTDNKGEEKKVSPNKTPVTDNFVASKIKKKRTVNMKDKANSKIKSPGTTKNNSPDTNNNAKKGLRPRNETKNTINKSPEVSLQSKTIKTIAKNNYSLKILDNNKKSLKRDVSNVDVYEFTYDPNEEPPPQKKKRKRPAKKREPKPKTVVFKNNYDRNLARALVALKNTVSSKSSTPAHNTDNNTATINKNTDIAKIQTSQANKITPATHPQVSHVAQVNPKIISPPLKETTECNPNPNKSNVSEKIYKSVIVEDIALDFEQDNDVDNINYSPVNTPDRPVSPRPESKNVQNTPHAHNKDPLNLRDGFSFFNDQPVASSSMNVSVRHPDASPWRAEFGSLPIKWQVNTYVKPNMTPAFESSFLNFNESKKKHVYTNLGPETNQTHDLPQIFDDNASKLKQTSIISFIKEVVEKSAKKRKEKLTPTKANSLFEDLHGTSMCNDIPIMQKQVTPVKNSLNKITSTNDVRSPSNSDVNSDLSNENLESNKNSTSDKENSHKALKNVNEDITYFGFDDTENLDQENVSPIKKIDKRRLRTLKPRSRAVLQEINEQKGPTRAILPVAVKSKTIQGSELANKLFDEIKSATEPPVFPDKEVVQSTETVNFTEVPNNENSTDPESVHLFEDLEFIHHLKAHRRSYGKPKKVVTFRQNSISDSDVPLSSVADQNESSDEDDLHDLTFKVPALEPKKTVKKKKTKKQKLSKKEEQEVEAWAAGFNSMCEDIEEFDLVVE